MFLTNFKTDLVEKIELNKIIIKNNSNGLEVIIGNVIRPEILISILHEKNYAIAMCIVNINM